MTIDDSDLNSFDFTMPLTQNSLVKCIECNRYFHIGKWKVAEASIEGQGDVLALICPYQHYQLSLYPIEVCS